MPNAIVSIFNQAAFAAACSVAAVVIMTLGISKSTHSVFDADGYDEVFTVVGGLLFLPSFVPVYAAIQRHSGWNLRGEQATRAWLIAMRAVVFLFHASYTAMMLALLVIYRSYWCLFLLVGDIPIVGPLLGYHRRFHGLAVIIFMLCYVLKMALLWGSMDAIVANKQEVVGINTLKVFLVFALPIVQFPVLIRTVEERRISAYEAFTCNMAATFVHTLHFLDCLDLYFFGSHSFSRAVHYLVLMFSLAGVVTTNMYYTTLFVGAAPAQSDNTRGGQQDDPVSKRNPFLADTDRDITISVESERDIDMFHYFLWMAFFVDIPFGCLRFVLWCVQSEVKLSTFFAKNILMVLSIAILLVKHSRSMKKKG